MDNFIFSEKTEKELKNLSKEDLITIYWLIWNRLGNNYIESCNSSEEIIYLIESILTKSLLNNFDINNDNNNDDDEHELPEIIDVIFKEYNDALENKKNEEEEEEEL